jgi:hypothetical protein
MPGNQKKANQKSASCWRKGWLNDPDISKYFIIKYQNLFFKRGVLGILGERFEFLHVSAVSNIHPSQSLTYNENKNHEG